VVGYTVAADAVAPGGEWLFLGAGGTLHVRARSFGLWDRAETTFQRASQDDGSIGVPSCVSSK
jgi:hypothetical protein